jgi:Zn-dependent peptidase ImmA (M78 family)
MSNSIFDTPEGRKAAFMMLYKQQKYDIVEIAKELDIEVIVSTNLPSETILGFIRCKSGNFQIIVNNMHKIDEPMTNARIQTTIAHEVAHWIYDYDDIKSGKIFCEDINDIFDTKEEKRAMQVANNIIMNLNSPLPE